MIEKIIELYKFYYHIMYLLIIIIHIIFIYFFILLNAISIKKKKLKINRQNYDQNLFTWKYAVIRMKRYYKDNMKSKYRFYTQNSMIVFILVWFISFLVINGYHKIYIEKMEKIYLVIIFVEYLLQIMTIKQRLNPNFNNVNHQKTCLIIPFGGSNLKDKIPTLEKVIKKSEKILKNNIFVAHNGINLKPELYDEIKNLCKKYKVKYIYIPLPNKSYSIYYCVKHLCKNYTQCIIIDDDVILKNDMHILELDNADSAAYPICAKQSKNNSYYQNTLIGLQNIEYTLSGMVKIAQSRWNFDSSVLSHHGAIGLWKTDKLLNVMNMHDTVFHGEDLQMGIISYRFGYKMKVVEGTFIPTETPKKIFGIGGLFNQRVYSWDNVLPKYIDTYLKLLLHGSISDNIAMKIYILLELWTTFADINRIPILLYVIINQPYNLLLFMILISIVNIMIIFWFNYTTLIHFNSESNFLSILLYPLYKILLIIFRIFGQLRYLFYYQSPQFRMPLMIKEMPELPNILNNAELEDIEWDQIWSNNNYLRKSININEEIFKQIYLDNKDVILFDNEDSQMLKYKEMINQKDLKKFRKKLKYEEEKKNLKNNVIII